MGLRALESRPWSDFVLVQLFAIEENHDTVVDNTREYLRSTFARHFRTYFYADHSGELAVMNVLS